tara:strand:- start:1049 stop:1537 length:489 start_codon:yes stop_codon:yes gene_type:complete
MSTTISISKLASKKEKYQALIPQIKSLIKSESDSIANQANLCAVLKYAFDFFWVGFYWSNSKELVLGPFQGPVACTRISFGKGVCGTAFQNASSIIVPDVNLFEGHIACSSETQSEIVIPILKNNKVIGVLDIDSDQKETFDDIDRIYLEEIAQLLIDSIDD